ncbi:MAG TPA: protein TolQ [Acidiferrobacteraceae bacterium]|mgnify:CR=1 FL=1|nr:protein TolQ [Acidiferrobacteraceae bacterium]
MEKLTLTASEHSLSLISMVTQASLVVQLVMLLLLVASILSWTMIFQKWFSLRLARSNATRFEDSFWSGGDMAQLYSDWSKRPKAPTGMASIFVSGYREYTRLNQKSGIDRADIVEGVQRAMRVALSRELDELETHLPFLASVGSTSPYVGLFGTVWGIMNSFRSLGTLHQATISSVAPGIAEALIATAMGLFAAIPAVITYNRFSSHVERLESRYAIFMEEFLSIVNRQVIVKKEQAHVSSA